MTETTPAAAAAAVETPPPAPRWGRRWEVIRGALLFMALVMLGIIVTMIVIALRTDETAALEGLASAIWMAAVAIIMSYAGLATAQEGGGLFRGSR